jgi:hypothetical protein
MRDGNTHIDELFEAVRSKPTELRLEDVDKMVAGFPLTPAPFDWSSIINLNSIIMTSVSAFIIAGSLMLYTGSAQNPETNPENQLQDPIAQSIIPNVVSETEPSEVLSQESPEETPAEKVIENISPEPAPEEQAQEEAPVIIEDEIAEEADEREIERVIELRHIASVEVPDEIHIELKSPRVVEPALPKVCDDKQTAAVSSSSNAADARLDFNVSDFDGVSLAGSMDVEIRQSNSFKVWAEGEDKHLEKLKVEVNNGKLRIGTKSKKDGDNCNTYAKCGDTTIYIEMPAFDDIDVAASGTITIFSFNGLGDVKFRVAGSGSIDVDGELEMNGKVDCSIAGSGKMNIDGTAQSADVSIAGSGDFTGLDLRVKDADISIAGSGNVGIHAEDNLKVSIAGSGDIEYVGDPSIKKSIMGSGSISRH